MTQPIVIPPGEEIPPRKARNPTPHRVLGGEAATRPA